MHRRHFLETAALGAGLLTTPASLEALPQSRDRGLPAPIQGLASMTAGIVPIGDDERRARIARAQRLMEEQKIALMQRANDATLAAYQAGLATMPHRTGHGIGLDGREWTNFVNGNTTPIRPGMCFGTSR